MPLSNVDRALANLGVDPRPVREKYEELIQPVSELSKKAGDYWYDFTTRMQGKEPVEVRVRDAFYRFDGDGNGHVDADELKLALGALGFNVDIAASEAILAHYDDDGNETLELEEFNVLVLAFEKISNVRVEDARLEEEESMLDSLKSKRLSRMSQAIDNGEALEVRRLSHFLEAGVTGLTPRGEDDIEAGGEGERDQGTSDTIEFLKSLNVTLKLK